MVNHHDNMEGLTKEQRFNYLNMLTNGRFEGIINIMVLQGKDCHSIATACHCKWHYLFGETVTYYDWQQAVDGYIDISKHCADVFNNQSCKLSHEVCKNSIPY